MRSLTKSFLNSSDTLFLSWHYICENVPEATTLSLVFLWFQTISSALKNKTRRKLIRNWISFFAKKRKRRNNLVKKEKKTEKEKTYASLFMPYRSLFTIFFSKYPFYFLSILTVTKFFFPFFPFSSYYSLTDPLSLPVYLSHPAITFNRNKHRLVSASRQLPVTSPTNHRSAYPKITYENIEKFHTTT